jgi:hypothetical protein
MDIHLLYPELIERDLAPDPGEVPAVFVVAQQAPDMQPEPDQIWSRQPLRPCTYFDFSWVLPLVEV